MSAFLETALDLARRGFHVFPLKPRAKSPIVVGGYKAATRDPDQLALWWKRTPDANIGIACGVSDLCVLDCDHGLTSWDDFQAWRIRNGLPETYTVRSGRRPEFGVQMYFKGVIADTKWELDGCSGDIKSIGGLVVAPPSIHPDSGEAYVVLEHLSIAPTPDTVKQLKKVVAERTDAGGIDTDNRNDEMVSFVYKIRKQTANLDSDVCLAACLHRNNQYSKGPMPEDEVVEIVRKQYRQYPDVGPDPVVTIGGKKEERQTIGDWREHYHTADEHDNVGPPEFLIDGFLQRQAIMGIGAFVGQKKTLLALNLAWSLCSGRPLFGKFKVTRQPSRVLYLGPENGLISFSHRVNQIGLRKYLGETFYYSTMSMPEKLPLQSMMREEIQGAAIFIDTAIRYTDGDENSATQMKAFAELAFALIRDGAECIILLHHSPKSTTKANELTLDNCFRGTGELTAFLSAAVGMRTQDMEDEYNSPSLIRFVKQRDFETHPSSFEVTTSRETCLMSFVDGSNGAKVTLKPSGPKADADGKDEMRLQVIRDNPDLKIKQIVAKLKEIGIERSPTWVTNKRFELLGKGVKVSETE